MNLWHLYWRFGLISVLAFGSGAGTPLIERIAVRETGWISEREFGVAIGLGQVTPGPVMVVATFIGYRASGIVGALVATFAVFLVPWALAVAAARHLGYLHRFKWIDGFRQGATAAAVGLFGVTALSLARVSLAGWAHTGIVVTALVLAVWTRIHPALILFGGAMLGIALGAGATAAG